MSTRPRPGPRTPHRFYVLSILMLSAAAFGQTTVPVDQTSPRSAVRSLSVAVERGDGQALRDLLLASDDTEQRVIELMADLAAASRQVRDASSLAFGEDAGGAMLGDAEAFTQIHLRIDDSLEKISEDTAVLTDGEGEELSLKLVDDKWRVPVDQIIGKVDPDVLEAYLLEGAEQVMLMNEFAAEIASGKFKSAQEAEQVMHARMMHGATQPANEVPATNPQ